MGAGEVHQPSSGYPKSGKSMASICHVHKGLLWKQLQQKTPTLFQPGHCQRLSPMHNLEQPRGP